MAATALLKHTWGTVVKNDSGSTQLNDSYTVVGTNEENFSFDVAAGATAEVDVGSIPFAKMVSFYIVATQNGTVYTNAADGTGGQVIPLTANKGYAWNNTLVASNPITANITKIYFTNSSTLSKATFKCGILLNQSV
jgi:hypothetical protein